MLPLCLPALCCRSSLWVSDVTSWDASAESGGNFRKRYAWCKGKFFHVEKKTLWSSINGSGSLICFKSGAPIPSKAGDFRRVRRVVSDIFLFFFIVLHVTQTPLPALSFRYVRASGDTCRTPPNPCVDEAAARRLHAGRR